MGWGDGGCNAYKVNGREIQFCPNHLLCILTSVKEKDEWMQKQWLHLWIHSSITSHNTIHDDEWTPLSLSHTQCWSVCTIYCDCLYLVPYRGVAVYTLPLQINNRSILCMWIMLYSYVHLHMVAPELLLGCLITEVWWGLLYCNSLEGSFFHCLCYLTKLKITWALLHKNFFWLLLFCYMLSENDRVIRWSSGSRDGF